MSTADKVKKTKKKPSGVSALSFDMGDEGEAFAVKKSKKSRGHKHLKTSGDAAPAVETQVSSGVYTADYLQQLRADTKFAPSSQAADGMDDADASEGLVPGVDDIRKARSERERARRLAEEQGGCGLAGPEGAAFIPLDGSAASLSNGSGGGGGKYGESRLVREDQEADDEADGAALAFGSVAAGGRPKPEMPTVQDLPEELGVADVDVKFGRRPGLNGAPTGAGASSSESLAEHAILLADATRAAAVPERLDDAVRRLGAQLTALQHEQTETVRLLQESAEECGQLEEVLDAELQTHVFMQHAQAYVEDLLACLTEKSPRVEECEAALCDALEAHHRASRAVQAQLVQLERQRAEASLGGSWRAPAPPPEASLSTVAERTEATERLSRLDAALDAAREDAAAAEPAGWTTSDDEGETCLVAAILGGGGGAPPPAAAAAAAAARALRQQAEQVLVAADDVFADTAAEFCTVTQLVGRFSEWRATHPPSYRDAFLPSCLPTILAPLVRLQLLRWWPLEQGSMQSMEWYSDVVQGWDTPGGARGGDAADDLGRRVLLAQLSCKLGLPRLKHVVAHSWRVPSRRQGVEVRRGVREFIGAAQQLRAASARLRGVDEDEAGALAAEEAEASAAVRELLLQVAMRLETSTTETCIPPCLAPDPPDPAELAAQRDAPARRAALRRMWRALKLMHTMNEWSELLATAALQELGGSLLSSQLLPYLRVQLTSRPPRLELVTAACERAVAAVPPAWRCRDGSGMLPVCAAPLHLFVQELGSAVRAVGAVRPSAGATGSGSLEERVAKLLVQLG